MDPFNQLLDLHQGSISIEEYATQFCVLSDKVPFDEVALKYIFCFGLSEPVKSWLPEGKFNVSLKDFMDYALLCAGSSFTVGVTEEERDTASVTEMADAPECTHKMADAITHRHFSADFREPSPITADHPESRHVTAVLLESRHITAVHPESRHVTADLPESRHVTADLPESRPITSDLPEPLHVSSDLPEPLHVMSTTPEPRPVAGIILQLSKILSREPVIKRKRLASSLEDPLLVSVAGISKPNHSSPPAHKLIPLSEVLPMMEIALCCVWAVNTTTKLPEVAASTEMLLNG